jgi:hypothetical protein
VFGLKGLLIDSPDVDQILAGRKRWEMRSAGTRQRGTIALVHKSRGIVVGLADLVESLGPLTENELLASFRLHLIPCDRLRSAAAERYRYAWVLDNARPLASPMPCRPPLVAVTWVNLGGELVNTLETSWVV